MYTFPNQMNGQFVLITAILSAHLLREFMASVKCRMGWSYRKPYICLSFNFFKQYPANRTFLTYVNMSAPSDLSERVKFFLTHTEILWLVKLSLRGKRMNFPGIATMSHTNNLRRSEIQMFFSNNRIEIGGQQWYTFVMFDSEDTAVFMNKAATCILYFSWGGLGK